MSLRPSIYAVDLAGFRALLAGDVGPLLEKAEEWYQERGIEEGLAEIRRDAEQLLSRAWAEQVERERQILVVAGAGARVWVGRGGGDDSLGGLEDRGV